MHQQTKLIRLIVPLAVCLGLAPMVQAVGPDTDGSMPASSNGEGIGVLVSRTTGVWNTGTGFEALNHLTGGNQNTATGVRALFNDTSGGYNTATGVYSLYTNTTGLFNSATGAYSLAFNTTGSYNTANGYSALYFNTEGERNTAAGFAALYHNTTGFSNTANGFNALFSNTIGFFNTANGAYALAYNTGGIYNTANGLAALSGNTTGGDNTAIGANALTSNTTGDSNTANGVTALLNNTTGDVNTAIGDQALLNNTTGSNNTALGFLAGYNLTTGSNNIDIGNLGVAAEANTIRIGDPATQTATYIAGVSGATVPTGVAVIVDGSGHLGTTTSSARFKEAIEPMDKASEAILALKPVTFHYKKELDPDGIPQFGLVAEQVEKVSPDLVVRDADGRPYTVRYEAVNAMLLNEFLKEHGKVEKLEATVTQQQKQIERLTAGLQKVSAQVEMRKPAPQTVANDR